MARGTERSLVRAGGRGFTLLELLVVLGILALLMTLIAPRLIGVLSKNEPTISRQQIANTVTALDMFRTDMGRYPSTEEGLAVLLSSEKLSSASDKERWRGPYYTKASLPKDAWSEELKYRSPAGKAGFEFEVFSLGADKKEGGEGANADLFSWQ